MDEEKRKKIETWYDENRTYHDTYCIKIKNLLEEIIKMKRVPYQSITSRVKGKKSFLEKCKKDKYNDPINEIMDIIGVRIIAYTNSDVLAICKIIENEFIIDKENSINKSDQLGDNEFGYLSMHYVVKLNKRRSTLPEYETFKCIKVEIQVRTLLQHAWAEIEHDRNYKFGGVLPKEIKRRFFLAAGILEMVDREFQNISDDIDRYVNSVKNKNDKDILNVSVDSTSLFEYMSRRFSYIWVSKTFNKRDKEIIDELCNYGIRKIKDIEDLIPPDFIEINEKIGINMNFVSLLITLMIINNAERYFEKSCNNHWNQFADGTERLLQNYNLPLDLIKQKYNILSYNESDDDDIGYEPDDNSVFDSEGYEPDDNSLSFN